MSALALALGLLLAAPPAAAPADVVVRQSGSRPEIILAPREAAVGSLAITFRAGIYDDAEKPGLTRLAQQALVGANARNPYEELDSDLYEAGATLSLETGVRDCTITLVAPRASFEKLAKKVLDLALRPAVDEAELANAKRRLLVEDLQPGTSVAVSALVARLVFQDEWRVFNDLFVDRDSLDQVTPTDVAEHLERKLAPANARVVVSGPFDPAKMAQHLKRYSGGSPARRLRPTVSPPLDVYVRSRSRLHLMAFPLRLDTPDQIARSRVLAALLEDRLYRRLRAEGAVYALSATVQTTEWLDFLMVILPTGERPAGTIEALHAELAALREQKFTDEELTCNVGHVLGEVDRADADPVQLVRALAHTGAGSGWLASPAREALGRVDRKAIAELAATALDAKNTLYVLYSPNPAEMPGGAH